MYFQVLTALVQANHLNLSDLSLKSSRRKLHRILFLWVFDGYKASKIVFGLTELVHFIQ